MASLLRISFLIAKKCCLFFLLGAGCNSQVMGLASDNFNLVLTSAIDGDKQQLQQIIQEGGSIDVVDWHGRSAVLVVTMQNNIKALQLLIELGADVDFYEEAKLSRVIDQTAFLYAGAHGMNEALTHLINAGARPNIYNYYGGTALIPAAEKGQVDTVRLLLEKSKIDVNHVNNLGWTALMEAVILADGGINHQQIVELLLAHGADPNITDNEGATVLDHARNRGFTSIVEILTREY